MAEYTILSEPLREELKSLIREVLAEGNGNGNGHASKEWLKAEELAVEYGLPKTWFEERGRAGDIARTKPGRYVLFKRRDVEAFLEKKKSNGTP
jgi:hypothetical protein